MGSMSVRDENALEPVELIKQSGAVLRAGRAILTSGTGSCRVKTAMDQVAHAFGLDRHEAHVTITEITGTSYRGPIFHTEVAEVHSMGVNSNKIKLLTELVNGLKPGATPDHVMSAVDRIDATPPLYPGWMNALSAGVACGAFSYLNNGSVGTRSTLEGCRSCPGPIQRSSAMTSWQWPVAGMLRSSRSLPISVSPSRVCATGCMLPTSRTATVPV